MGEKVDNGFPSLLGKVCYNCNSKCKDLMVHTHESTIRKYCEACYQKLYAHPCQGCGSSIILRKNTDKEVELRGKFWHANCFRCATCASVLAATSKPRFANGRLQCSACGTTKFSDTCAGCGETLKSGDERDSYQARYWHKGCYCCIRCKTSLDSKILEMTDSGPVCPSCYDGEEGRNCAKCGQRTDKQTIAWGDVVWHRACFTCTNCAKLLADLKFFSRDDKPYCTTCFDTLFSEHCAVCKATVGGGSFVRVEDKCWHRDCFVCGRCSSFLGREGYYPHSGAIYCQECFAVVNKQGK